MRLLLLLLVAMVAGAYSHGFVTEEERLTIQTHDTMAEFHQDLEIHALFGVGHRARFPGLDFLVDVWNFVRDGTSKVVDVFSDLFRGKVSKKMEASIKTLYKRLKKSKVPKILRRIGIVADIVEVFELGGEILDVIISMQYADTEEGTGLVYQVKAKQDGSVLEEGFLPSETDPLDEIFKIPE